jgi:hypothetical protein
MPYTQTMTINNLNHRRILLKWMPWAFSTVLLCGLVYAAVQQDLRQSANDPQIQIAEDGAARLRVTSAGTPIVPVGDVDIATSLSPYIIYFDDSGKPVSGNGVLDAKLPTLPAGVFAYTRTAREDRFTWQPRSGIRQAVVLVRIDGTHPGFVMSGRSLREVELRERALSNEIGIALLVILLGTLTAQAWIEILLSSSSS